MPIPAAVRAILGNVWASAAGALKQDPSAASPAIDRAAGYPASFSSTLTPEQETIQGRWNEFDSAIDDIYTSGVPFYDDEIDYPEHAVTNEEGVLYRAMQANGPSTTVVQPSTDTARTTWATVTGTQAVPAAPNQPTATAPSSGVLEVSWNCPLDNGAAISTFTFQYRVAGDPWSNAQTRTPTVPFVRLTGLTNGQGYEFRVRATNAIGDSAWSATGTGTPGATVPGGGSTLALTARAGDARVILSWLEPDDGGSAITSYDVQWRADSQAFSSSRQTSVTTETYTRSGLPNGTLHHFRVRAVNAVGNGAWSNEASVRPEPSAHSVLTAGSTMFSWPWADSTSATVMVTGAAGGGGGGGGAGSVTQAAGGDGGGSDGGAGGSLGSGGSDGGSNGGGGGGSGASNMAGGDGGANGGAGGQQGGGGGGGGSGGGAGGRGILQGGGGGGERGGAGGDSTVTTTGGTILAAGGAGGGGGGGGAGGGGGVSTEGEDAVGGGTGGAGGMGASAGNDGGDGAAGQAGGQTTMTIAGMSLNDSISIVVGAGGAGGEGGDGGGTAGDGNDGTAGNDGAVTITPIR